MIEEVENTDLQAVQDRQEVVRVGAQLLGLVEVREAVIRLVEVALVREAATSQADLVAVVLVRGCQGQAQVVPLPVLEVQVLLQEGLV